MDSIRRLKEAEADETIVKLTQENEALRRELGLPPGEGAQITPLRQLKELGEVLGPQGGELFPQFYDGKSDATQYGAAFMAYYHAGEMGGKITAVQSQYAQFLEPHQRMQVYRAGQMDAQTRESAATHSPLTVDKIRAMSYNESIDRKQFAKYQDRLGKDGDLRSFDAFQKLKYFDPEGYADLKSWYSYKGRVPEATRADFNAYKAVKDTGVFGFIRVPPKLVDVEGLAFKDDHATRHGCTLEDAKHYISTAKCSITRERWDGQHTSFYSFDGATYVDDEKGVINTAFSKASFDPSTRAILEVFK